MELPSIEIGREDLLGKLNQIQRESTPEELRHLFNGNEFKVEHRKEKKVYFWRFKIMDSPRSQNPYEIYMGEFIQERLVFGVLLPRG